MNQLKRKDNALGRVGVMNFVALIATPQRRVLVFACGYKTV